MARRVVRRTVAAPANTANPAMPPMVTTRAMAAPLTSVPVGAPPRRKPPAKKKK